VSKSYSILVLEDEPMILLDLEFAAEDRGCVMHCASSCDEAVELIGKLERVDVAILDVSLGRDETCFPVARELERRKIPYILHTGDLDRQNEQVRELDAELISKPAPADKVIAAAIVHCEGGDTENLDIAAE
jgi:DNA-binding response OmpR family regulator